MRPAGRSTHSELLKQVRQLLHVPGNEKVSLDISAFGNRGSMFQQTQRQNEEH